MDSQNYNSKFKLNPTAVLVKGYTRSIICDIERDNYYFIPNAMALILLNEGDMSISQTVECYAAGDNEIKSIIVEYFDFLLANDLIIFSQNLQLYKKLELEYDYPGDISNGIIDISDSRIEYGLLFISQCDAIQCASLQVRCYNPVPEDKILKLIDSTFGSVVEWLEIIHPFSEELKIEFWEELMNTCERLRTVILYGCSDDKILFQKKYGIGRVVGVKGVITNHQYCGIVGPEYFCTNIIAVSESVNFNSCLNRKIAIDVFGNIKNCPSMMESFGNIMNTTLVEAIAKPGFKNYWNITKDKVHVCKDCEFRYICTDCRAYIEDPEDIFSKPLKCGYNPYTGEWSEWSTNPLKQKAIQYYGMEEIVAERLGRIQQDAGHDEV